MDQVLALGLIRFDASWSVSILCSDTDAEKERDYVPLRWHLRWDGGQICWPWSVEPMHDQVNGWMATQHMTHVECVHEEALFK